MSVARAPSMILPKLRLKNPGLCPLVAAAAAPAAASPAAAAGGGVVAAVLVLPLVPLVLRPRRIGWLAVPRGRRAPSRSCVMVEVVVERPCLDLGWVWVLLCGRVAASQHRRPLLPMSVAVGEKDPKSNRPTYPCWNASSDLRRAINPADWDRSMPMDLWLGVSMGPRVRRRVILAGMIAKATSARAARAAARSLARRASPSPFD